MSHVNHQIGRISYGRYIAFVLACVDLFLFNLCLIITSNQFIPSIANYAEVIALIAIMNLLWGILGFNFNLFEAKRLFRLSKIVMNIWKMVLLHFLITYVATSILLPPETLSNEFFIWNYALLGLVIPSNKVASLFALRKYRQYGYNYKNVVILGANERGFRLYQYIQDNPSLGLKFKGFLDDHTSFLLYADMVKGSIHDAQSYCKEASINEIFCALPNDQLDMVPQLISFADNNMIRFRMIPEFPIPMVKGSFSFFDQIPVLTPRREPLESHYNRLVKRVFDVLFSAFALGILSFTVFPAIAAAIKFSSPGPILFSQKRSGKNNEEFFCLKFRSMHCNDQSDTLQATENDDRITPVGRFLRRTNLDELPQFWNVLCGDMSVVGPRPHMVKHTEEYAPMIDKYMVRHFVKPGITGWAQVNGFRGQTEEPELMQKRIEHDMWYVENWDIFLDMRIVLLTVFNMIKGEENAR
ncbi:MAG: undecaprenyl-phosphate glucose phosphotransferase [Bacteroidota bacterium]